MARLNIRADSSDIEPPATSSSSGERHATSPETPASNIESEFSDKENQTTPRSKRQAHKRKSNAAPMSERGEPSASSSKRRRVEERPRTQSSRTALQKELDERGRKDYYDPDQNEAEKRAVKRKLRDLTSRVNDSRAEFLRSGNTGIVDTLKEADEIYKNVKQTSAATIDSRLLVTVGDLAYKKVNTLSLGDTSTGIDVDDFVTKCISFMKGSINDPSHNQTATQSTSTQRRRRREAEADEEEDGEPMDWIYLGKNACLLYNARPSLPGFLLGPLSVQKKVRQQTQRRAKEARSDPSQATRPVTLGQEDLEKQESANLTVVCSEIAHLLDNTIKRGEARVEEEYEALATPEYEPTDDEMRLLMSKHGLSDNACVPLFNFCVNPQSFGQTVENMFYVSFLIKEGRVGLDFDSNGLPTLGTAAADKTFAEHQETQRNQAVFTLDFDIWKELVTSFSIEKSIIPHREEEEWDDGTV